MRSWKPWGRVVVGVALAGAAGCSSDENGLASNAGDPCAGVYADECGKSCTEDTDCASGLHCGLDSTCTAECVTGDGSCGPGRACDAHGSCVPDIHDGGVFDASVSDGPAPESCGDVAVTLERVVPTVVLLIDQSGSMTESFGGTTRWNAVRQTLMSPGTGVVAQLEGDVRLGLTLYTSHKGSAGGTCPEHVSVAPEIMNYSEINAVYASAEPEQDTPTGDSLHVVAGDLEALDVEGDKIIVLATDGEPDSCADPDGNANAFTVAAAQAAFAAGIRIYIIGVGDGVGAAHLQDMANAGVGEPSNGTAPFWQAFDAQGLVDAFQAIITAPPSCIFTLNGEVVAGMESEGSVTLDGTPLGYNDSDGWRLNGSSEIEILGAACDAIKEGQHELTASFPCDAVVLGPPK